ncbi:MAG: Arm DNA-binding domain-containing protein [Deltaproteobacteria bacterium]|nr:Arm DNA-binding domain-containing protein [Deltaproteobacteria bacterium]
MALKDLEIKNLKPPEKPKKLYDGGGLFLCLAPGGLKSWRHECLPGRTKHPDLRNLPGRNLERGPREAR